MTSTSATAVQTRNYDDCRGSHEINPNQIHFNSSSSSCQQKCVNTIGSYKCECFDGFRHNEHDMCIDIDECKSNNFRCPHAAQCINTAGSYKCICAEGFKLSRDKSECIEIKNECKAFDVEHGAARCTRSR
jgi:Calcium-binding EGF domain